MKRCSQCKEIRDRKEFGTLNARWDGLRPQCLLCHRRNAAIIHSRRSAAAGSYSRTDVDRLFQQQDGKCAYCSCKLRRFHVDHIIPLARGGSNWPDNLALACTFCNLSKGAKTPEEFSVYRDTKQRCTYGKSSAVGSRRS